MKQTARASSSPIPPRGDTTAPGDRRALAARVRGFPRTPGVYQWRDADGKVLYVGKANDLRARTLSYVTGTQDAKTTALMDQAADIDYIATHTEKEALILEQTLIKKERPRYNIRLTDDKRYPYIHVTNEEFPRVVYTRDVASGGTVFGPFPDALAAKHITRLLNRTFLLRQCRTLPKRACIYHEIGQCLAHCIQAVPDAEYADAVESARRFLAGGGRQLVGELKRRMRDAADAERFEEAAQLRDTVEALESVLERQRVFAHHQEDRDVIALARGKHRAAVVVLFVREGSVVGREVYFLTHTEDAPDEELVATFCSQYYGTAIAVPRELIVPVTPASAEVLAEWLAERRGGTVRFNVPQRGERRRVLEMAQKNADLVLTEDRLKRERDESHGGKELAHLLNLNEIPRVIDGFDISHHGGEHTVSSMVRFEDGRPAKSMYRHYRIRGVVGIDDPASIREAVQTHFESLAKHGEELPDLVLIDGGRPQLNAARAAIHHLGLTAEVRLCSLAKREEEIYLVDRPTPIQAPAHHPGRQLLERVRDEAHRFAVKYQDKLKRRALTKSPLLDVAGIGPKRVRVLLRAYGDLRGLAAAEPEEVARLPGVTLELARAVVAAARTAIGPA
jgi:excinuclease ABC subunit C